MSVSIFGILLLGSRPINAKESCCIAFKLEALDRLNFSLVTVLSLVNQEFNHLGWSELEAGGII